MASSKPTRISSKLETLPPDALRLLVAQDKGVLPNLYMVPSMKNVAEKEILSSLCPDPILPDEFASYIVYVVNNPQIYLKTVDLYSVAIRSYRNEEIIFGSAIVVQHIKEKNAIRLHLAVVGNIHDKDYKSPINKQDEKEIYDIVKRAVREEFSLMDGKPLLSVDIQKWVYNRRLLCIKDNSYFVSKSITRNVLDAMDSISPSAKTGVTVKVLLREYHGKKNIDKILIPRGASRSKKDAFDLLFRYLLDIRVKRPETLQKLFPKTPHPSTEEKIRALLQDLFDFLRVVLEEDLAKHENREP